MENVLNNLLLLIESNCNEGTYIKASNLIKEAYQLQNKDDTDSDDDDVSPINIDFHRNTIDLTHHFEITNALEERITILKQEIEELNDILNDIVKKKTTEFNEYKKKSNEKKIELLQEIRELNKELRNKSIN